MIRFWPRQRISGIAPSMSIQTRQRMLVIELGRSRWYPLASHIVLRGGLLTIWWSKNSRPAPQGSGSDA